jgi:hypothetical protein
MYLLPIWPVLLVLLAGCADNVEYTIGASVTYATRCAARMAVEGDTYRALCDPPACSEGFNSVGINQVAVALDPGNKVVGNAERICVQDLTAVTKNQNLAIDGKSVTP